MDHSTTIHYLRQIEQADLSETDTFRLQCAVIAASFIESCQDKGKDPLTTLHNGLDADTATQLPHVAAAANYAITTLISQCEAWQLRPRAVLERLLEEAISPS